MGLLQREELRTLIKHRTLNHFSPVGYFTYKTLSQRNKQTPKGAAAIAVGR